MTNKLVYNKDRKIKEFFQLYKERDFDIGKLVKELGMNEKYKEETADLDDRIRDVFNLDVSSFILSCSEINVSSVKGFDNKDYLLKEDNRKRLCLFDKNEGFKKKGEYDSLLIIGSDENWAPAIMKFRYRKFLKRKEENSEIIHELFDKRPAYGAVITEDTFSREGMLGKYNRKLARNFGKRGGVIIPLPMSKDELREEVRKECLKNEIKFKEYQYILE